MPSFLKYWQGKSKQFSAKLVSATAPRKYSCFTNLILLNLVANLTKLLSSTLTRWTSSSFSYQRQRQCSKVCCLSISRKVWLRIIFYHSRFVPHHSVSKALKSPTSPSALREHVVYRSWFSLRQKNHWSWLHFGEGSGRFFPRAAAQWY